MRWVDNVWPFGDPHEEERLSALLDDELDTEQSLEVTRHVAGCDRCLAELEAIRVARSAVRGLPGIEVPQDVFDSVLGARELAPGRRHERALRLAAAVGTAAAVVGAAAFLAGSDEAGTVSPPVDLYVADHVASNGGPVITPVQLGR